MKKPNFLKKCWYSLIYNIPYYKINDDKNNIIQQTKIQTKVLELITPKNFKILNSGFMEVDKKPIFHLPDFIQILWPKGIDESCFKSYQITKYYEDLGMMNLKITLSTNVSKEYLIKGFDTWEDVLRQCEEFMHAHFSSLSFIEALSQKDFVINYGDLTNNLIVQNLFVALTKNKFIKTKNLHFVISNIDLEQTSFEFNITWDLNSKYNYANTILESAYLKDIKQRRNNLLDLLNSQEAKDFVQTIDVSKIHDENYLTRYFLQNFQQFFIDNNLLNIKCNLFSLDTVSGEIKLRFYDENIFINIFATYTLTTLISFQQSQKQAQLLCANFDFLKELLSTYENDVYFNKNTEISQDWLNKYWKDQDHPLKINTKKHNFLPYFMFDLIDLQTELVLYSANLSLPSAEDIHNVLSEEQLANLIFNDVNFLAIILNNYQNYANANAQNHYVDLINKYDGIWKQRINDLDPLFEIYISVNEQQASLNLEMINNGIRTIKELFDDKIHQYLVIKNIANNLFENQDFISYLKQLSYADLMSQKYLDVLNQYYIQNSNNNLINIFDYINFDLVLDVNFYSNMLLQIKDKTSTNVLFEKEIFLDNFTYIKLSELIRDPRFSENLINQFPNLFSDQSFDELDLINLLNNWQNGLSFKGITFNKVNLINDEQRQEVTLQISFASVYPDINLQLIKQQEISLVDLVNQFSEYLEKTWQDIDVTCLKCGVLDQTELNKWLDQNQLFNSLKNTDLVLEINSIPNINKSLNTTFSLTMLSKNIEISTYAINKPILLEIWNKLWNEISIENKNVFIDVLKQKMTLDYFNNSDNVLQLLKDVQYPSYLKLNKLSFKYDDINHQIQVYYANINVTNIDVVQ